MMSTMSLGNQIKMVREGFERDLASKAFVQGYKVADGLELYATVSDSDAPEVCLTANNGIRVSQSCMNLNMAFKFIGSVRRELAEEFGGEDAS